MSDLALEFYRRGHDVTVLTPSDRISNDVEVKAERGIRVVRVRTGRIKGAAKIFRALEEIRLPNLVWRRAGRIICENPADLIVFYSPTIFWGSLVARLKTLWGCPSYLILRDIFPAWAVDAGLLRKGLVYRFFRFKESLQYKAADRIAVQSPGDLGYFGREFQMCQDRLEVLYNWMNLREEDLPSTNCRQRLGWQEKIVFFYGGNLGVAQDLDNIVRLAEKLSTYDSVRILLVGEGSEKLRLKKSLADKQLRNVEILPSVDPRTYLAMLSEFDVGLLSLDRRLTTHNVPGKLLGYMYWGKPILASINPGNDLFDLFKKYPVGVCLPNGEDHNLCDAALAISRDPDLRTAMGKESRKLLERLFSVDAAAEQILGSLLSKTAPSETRPGHTLSSSSTDELRVNF
jgi:glycosyltransferase involved in cell wall biosynthesis